MVVASGGNKNNRRSKDPTVAAWMAAPSSTSGLLVSRPFDPTVAAWMAAPSSTSGLLVSRPVHHTVAAWMAAPSSTSGLLHYTMAAWMAALLPHGRLDSRPSALAALLVAPPTTWQPHRKQSTSPIS